LEHLDEPSPESIINAANATASITPNKGQMPTGNQESGSQAIQMMGDRAKGFSNNTEHVVVVDLATVMVNAGANMLEAACFTVPDTYEDNTDPNLLVDS
jgi:hypothetical protein